MPHPDADRIRLADVDAGDGVVRVVSGTPTSNRTWSCRFAGRCALAGRLQDRAPQDPRPGLGKGCCAPQPLSSASATITPASFELSPDAPLGTDVREVLGLDDVVFDLQITPNRPDAMGIIGVARELAAHLGLPLDVPVSDVGQPAVLARAARRSSVDAPTAAPASSQWSPT